MKGSSSQKGDGEFIPERSVAAECINSSFSITHRLTFFCQETYPATRCGCSDHELGKFRFGSSGSAAFQGQRFRVYGLGRLRVGDLGCRVWG